jgi:hypothetical protein
VRGRVVTEYPAVPVEVVAVIAEGDVDDAAGEQERGTLKLVERIERHDPPGVVCAGSGRSGSHDDGAPELFGSCRHVERVQPHHVGGARLLRLGDDESVPLAGSMTVCWRSRFRTRSAVSPVSAGGPRYAGGEKAHPPHRAASCRRRRRRRYRAR